MLRSLSHLPHRFFGLTVEYLESVYNMLDDMRYHGGWSFSELYSFPIGLRNYLSRKLAKQLEKEAEEIRKATKTR